MLPEPNVGHVTRFFYEIMTYSQQVDFPSEVKIF